MARSPVEIVREVYEGFGQGDFAAVDAFMDPLALLVMGPGFPDSGTYLGVERIAEYTRGFLEPWTKIAIEAEELEEAGDSVVATVRQHGAGVGSGAVTDFRYAQLWTFRGEKVVRLETFRELAEARRAAGLS